MKDIVTVPDGLPASALARAGAFTLWRLDGAVDYQKLSLAWIDAGLDPDNLLAAASEEVALHRACKEHARGGTRCHKLPDGGWALIDSEEAGDTAGADLDFSTALRAWRNADGSLRFAPDTDKRTGIVEEDYYRHQLELSPTDISSWLSGQVSRLRAAPLRDTGGVYFMPATSMDEWRSIIEVLRSCTRHKIFAVPALENDADTVALILDGVSQEAEALLKQLADNLERGEESLGPRALKTRKEKLKGLEDKLGMYEKLLGTSLDEVRDKLDEVDDEVSISLIAAEAERNKKAQEAAA